MKNKPAKIGVLGLTAFVLSAMMGGGIFDLPENMATHAGLIAQIITWTLSGLIIWFVVQSFMVLSQVRPKHTTGIYSYAEAGFGKFTAFFVSFGYWICFAFAVGAFLVLLMSTLDAFWPGTFTNGNTVPAIIGGSIILWILIGLICRGIKVSSGLNVFSTIFKVTVVIIFLIAMIVALNWKTFTTNAMGTHAMPALQDKALGNLAEQVKGSMLTTLWVFCGVEGAVVLSGQAKSQKDVRRGTVYGFLICLVLYSLASILPLGIRSYGQLSKMAGPSTAGLLQIVMGPFGRLLITVGVIISVLGSSITWIILISQMTHASANHGTFPKIFRKRNRNGSPYISILASGIIIQLILLMTFFAGRVFNVLTQIVATMAIAPHLISMLYLVKISWHKKDFNPNDYEVAFSRKHALVVAILASLGTLLMAYAAGLKLLTIAFVIYAVGLPVFVYARKQNVPDEPIFGKYEKWFAVAIIIIAIIGLFLIFK